MSLHLTKISHTSQALLSSIYLFIPCYTVLSHSAHLYLQYPHPIPFSSYQTPPAATLKTSPFKHHSQDILQLPSSRILSYLVFPVVELMGDINLVSLLSNTTLTADLVPSPNPYTAASYLNFLLIASIFVCAITLTKLVIATVRLHTHLNQCSASILTNAAVSVCLLESLSSICTLIHFRIDPW